MTKAMTKSVDPESNQGPSDLQSDALPTELSTGTIVSWALAYIVANGLSQIENH